MWSDFLGHPVWVVSTALLAFVVRLQRRGRWDPQACKVRLRGKTAIVTGANTGIGKFIALDFARHGARVILACQSEERGTAALKEIRERTGNSDVHLCLVDVSSLDSVREFAKKILEEEKALHILVNNAAVSGIGKFIALDFARRGARVILACRSEERGTAALKEIRERTGNSDVHLRLVDVSSLDSVREFAKKILEEEKALHILVNNAAVSGLPRQITKDGLDVSFATNHLGPFLLTNLLLDLLKCSAPSRIVTLSSVSHKRGEVDFSHFHGQNLHYYMDIVYNNTKLHNIICTNELARRLQGTGVTANSVHPGVVMTEVMRHYSWIFRLIFNLIGFFFFKSPEEGAISPIYCAVAEETEGITGKYFDSDCSLILPAPLARDAALAVKDFEMCERVTSKLGNNYQACTEA